MSGSGSLSNQLCICCFVGMGRGLIAPKAGLAFKTTKTAKTKTTKKTV